MHNRIAPLQSTVAYACNHKSNNSCLPACNIRFNLLSRFNFFSFCGFFNVEFPFITLSLYTNKKTDLQKLWKKGPKILMNNISCVKRYSEYCGKTFDDLEL